MYNNKIYFNRFLWPFVKSKESCIPKYLNKVKYSRNYYNTEIKRNLKELSEPTQQIKLKTLKSLSPRSNILEVKNNHNNISLHLNDTFHKSGETSIIQNDFYISGNTNRRPLITNFKFLLISHLVTGVMWF